MRSIQINENCKKCFLLYTLYNGINETKISHIINTYLVDDKKRVLPYGNESESNF